jgi:HAD superfamily hydrolase (TIGR01509 family)
MGRFRVIIYDCDGVLIDSRESNRAFYDHILGHFGLPCLSPEQMEFAQVSTAQQAVELLFGGTPWLEAAQEYQRHLDNRPFIALVRLEPQVREVLTQLRGSYLTAIATNRGKSLPLVLRHFGLEVLFDLTVSSYDVTQPKPHPECLWQILNHFGLQPAQALYIGDAEVDRLVAAQAGVTFAAYRHPGLEARYHLRGHLELLDFLAEKEA